MTTPRLQMRLSGNTAFCARCGSPVGRLNYRSPVNGTIARGSVALEHGRGTGWVETSTDPVAEYELRRRRHPSPLTGGSVNYLAAFALPGDVVRCPKPKCAARQRVPVIQG